MSFNCTLQFGKRYMVNAVHVTRTKGKGREAAGERFRSDDGYVGTAAFSIPNQVQRFRS